MVVPLLFPGQLCLNWGALERMHAIPQVSVQALATLPNSCPLEVRLHCIICTWGVSVTYHCVTSSPKLSTVKQRSFHSLISQFGAWLDSS